MKENLWACLEQLYFKENPGLELEEYLRQDAEKEELLAAYAVDGGDRRVRMIFYGYPRFTRIAWEIS